MKTRVRRELDARFGGYKYIVEKWQSTKDLVYMDGPPDPLPPFDWGWVRTMLDRSEAEMFAWNLSMSLDYADPDVIAQYGTDDSSPTTSGDAK